jgi:glycoside/pentoside/hexuronide:cation symporter, GPH family
MASRADTGKVVFYAAPGMAPALINLPAAVILPTLYVENTAVTLAAIGLVNLLRWWFDAVTDPLVGYLSDRSVQRWGGRKTWVVLGACFSAGSAYFLFQPTSDSGALYYALSLLGVYLGFTCFTIAHQAWGSEIAADYHDRSRIFAYYSMFTIVGSLLIWILPLLAFPWTSTLEITPAVMGVLAWVVLLLFPGSALLAAVTVPAGGHVTAARPELRPIIRSIRVNKALWRYIVAVAIWGIGQGIGLSVLFIFLRDYMLLGDRFPILMIAFFGVQAASIPFWRWTLQRWGKHRPWALSWAAGAVMAPLVLLLEPGPGAFIYLLPLIMLQAFINGGAYIGPVALLGDLADYSMLKTGANTTGNLFAFKSLLEKANFGIGAGIAFPLLALVDYRIGESNGELANLGLLVLYLGVPGVTALVAAAVLWNFPLDERRYGIVRRRLERLAARRQADGAVLTSSTTT